MAAAGMLFKGFPAAAQGGGESPVLIIRKAAVTAKITTTPLRGGIFTLEGSGGNVAVIPGKDGKMLIDAGIDKSKSQLTAALNAISNDPITQLINTHWHFDHTDGNLWLHQAGASITGHTNTRKHLSRDTRVEDWNFTFPASPTGALPVTMFESGKTIHHNGKTIVLRYYGPAHTDSDISVHFQEDDVLHVADTWWNGVYPFIDYNTGGNIDGMIRAAEHNLKVTTSETVVIPGHGPLGSRADMEEYHRMLTTIRKSVADLKKQGRSMQEAIAAKPSKAFDGKWGQFVIGPDLFVRLVYKGV
jgi:glyoxylase-like metal-dependent hydrolase (beta-lactamase superfamily II)